MEKRSHAVYQVAKHIKKKVDKRDMAICLLREKAAELGRLPKKQDFDGNLVREIKASLGPWPRALEKAGLKPIGETYLERRARQEGKSCRKSEVQETQVEERA